MSTRARASVSFRDMRTFPSRVARTVRVALRAALPFSAAACASAARRPSPVVSTESEAPIVVAAGLPAVAPAEGALAIRVVYPGAGASVSARDSNFVLGSVGTGRASLHVNGTAVRVYPNGAFIAWLAVPAGDAPAYELVAVAGADTARLTVPVRVPPPRQALPDTGRLVVDSGSVVPRARMALRPDELVRVSVRAPANASVWVQLDSARRALVSEGARPEPASGGSPIAGRFLGDPRLWTTEVPARSLARAAPLVVARGADTVRLALPAVEIVDPAVRQWALAGADSSAVSDTDRVVVARPAPAGTYAWFLLPGTRLETTGHVDGFTRVRFDQRLEAWMDDDALRALPPGGAAPRRVIGAVSVVSAPEWVDVVLPVGERPPYLVEEQGRTLVLTLYGTTIAPGLIRYLENDTLVRHIVWEQTASDRARLTIHLSAPPFGYLVFWDRGSVVLRIRRPPVIEGRRPLRGLTIAVDAGHPPAGTTGPTGLYEGDAVLPVARRVQELLQERGATVVMTRTTPAPVPLTDRPIVARRANAHALVSIHLNASPDGVNPIRENGTSVLYFHPQAEPLARAIQRALVRQFGTRDLGVHYQNIALGRQTWMPSVLTEGLFLIMPEQEAAMRTAEGRERYARGIVEGLERYFRALGDRP